MRNVVYESQRQGKSDEMDKMFKQKMNGQETGCGCFGECECVQKSPVLMIDSKKREYKVRKVIYEVAVVHVWM